jgi:hypothetical protein
MVRTDKSLETHTHKEEEPGFGVQHDTNNFSIFAGWTMIYVQLELYL